MKWNGEKSFPHIEVCCWSTRSGGVSCGVWCGVLCCVVLCCVVSVVLLLARSCVLDWHRCVAGCVVKKKRHTSSIADP